MERSFRVIAGFLFAASLFSCNFSKIQDFQLGKDFVSSTSGVVMIDTMKLVASTIHFDSIVTSKLGRLLVGGNQNSFTGNVTCSPYFQLHSGTFATALPSDLVYDSIVVKFNYDGYYVGDTTKLVSFSAKQLVFKQGYNSNGTLYNISPFKLNTDGYLYNTSTFQLANESLGDIQLLPHPTSKKDFYFRLSDNYGRLIYNKILAKNDSMQNLFNFKVFLPGIALVCTTNKNQTAVGIAQNSISMRVYYHELINPTEVVNPTYFNFPVDGNGIWFNQILYNSQGSYLGTISEDQNKILASNELPSSSTNSQTMVQAGSGLYTKIRIPGAEYLKGYAKNLILINATIQLNPLVNSYARTNPLPDTLAVYIVDRRNIITGQYTTSLGSNIYATKVIPKGYDQFPYYMLDVTQYLSNELSSQTPTGNSLLLGTLSAKSGQTLNYFSFAGNALNSNLFNMSVLCYIDKSN